jgi:hypothetical protein
MRAIAQRTPGTHRDTNGGTMRRTLALPDGRTVETTSTKRWHVVIEHPQRGLVRRTSSDSRERALSAWRQWREHGRWAGWVLDADTGTVVRSPDSPRLPARRLHDA